MPIRHVDHNLNRLTVRQKELLADQLYPIHCTIFKFFKDDKLCEFSREYFDLYVFFPKRINQTYLRIYYDNAEIVGYHAVHIYPMKIDEEECKIFRAEAGLLAKYRGHVSLQNYLNKLILQELFSHPFIRLYYLGTLVHPSSYMVLAKYLEKIYPHPLVETPKKISSIRDSFFKIFDLEVDDALYPHAVKVGWVTEQSSDLLKRTNIFCRYFLQQNPKYQTKGTGLLTIIPLSFPNLFWATLHNLTRTTTKAYRHKEEFSSDSNDLEHGYRSEGKDNTMASPASMLAVPLLSPSPSTFFSAKVEKTYRRGRFCPVSCILS